VWSVDRLNTAAWPRLRGVRLRALADEPDAFASSAQRESEYGESQWRRLLELGPWWLAVAAGADVGIVAGALHREFGTPWVLSMWVDPRWRGTGVAPALLDKVVDWAAEQGALSVGLDVADRVPRARRFYERYGFADANRSFLMPRDPTITLVEMCMELSARPSDSPATGSP